MHSLRRHFYIIRECVRVVVLCYVIYLLLVPDRRFLIFFFLFSHISTTRPLFFYGFVISGNDALFLDETTSWSAENKHIIRVIYCSLSLGASVRWMMNAYLAVRAAPYMSHRCEGKPIFSLNVVKVNRHRTRNIRTLLAMQSE